MGDRAHLSIGEVLSLLREEFPDITISKIRFLESQGLLDPERTPSGYRKFYDEDVERLRWILRQQREHFLPLKVIKGRLAGPGAEVEADEEPEASSPIQASTPAPGTLAGVHPGVSAAPSAREEAVPSWSSGSQPGRPGLPTAEPAPMAVPSATATPEGERPGNASQAAGGMAARRPAPPGASGPPSAAATRGGPEGEARPGSPPPGLGGPPRGLAGAGDRRVAAGDDQGGSQAHAPPGATAPGPATAGTAGPSSGSGGADTGEPGAVSLTLNELAAAAGLDNGQVRDLIRYGLVAGRDLGGTVYFDGEALALARLAAAFARHGVEARHLRMYKNAADRETGLFEQVVMPLYKQRNPRARQQAAGTLDELSRLGAELRDALLRTALRNTF